MEASSTVKARAFRNILDGIVALGGDAERICAAAGLPVGALDDSDARLPAAFLARILCAAESLLGDPHLGLHLGERRRPVAANVPIYLAMSSRTLREGIERYLTYQQLAGTPNRSFLEDHGEIGFCGLDFDTMGPSATVHVVEQGVVTTLHYFRWITGSDFDPVKVQFRHARPADVSEHERIFRCPVAFGAPRDGLWIASRDLGRPSAHADPVVAAAHERYARDLLERSGEGPTVRELKAALAPSLEGGPLDLRAAAKRIGLSRRTLQRRLADEGRTYREVVDELRRDLSLHRLGEADAPIEEVAYLAGFSDTSAFYRAFRRWTGKTPAEYRASPRRERLPPRRASP